MRKPSKKRSVALLYPVGSLTAISEIMLILWITSLFAGMAIQVQMSEAPLPSMNDQPPTETTFDHAVVVGPGNRVALDGRPTTVEALVEDLRGTPDVKVELRAAHDVDASLFFRARFSIRQAGIAYVERPPTTQEGGTAP
jgi:hypothetical protein